ncbi:MAG: hypothetical protein FWC39_05125 [Bacteroidetes bacterium]|nr:hypothetical protein [Bacteroidota bacterium]
MKTPTLITLTLIISLLFSCNRIETEKTLKKADKLYIRSVIPIDEDEKIHKFYSEYKLKVAGNFFTDKRIVSYWIDERDITKNKIIFAHYSDIISIDTVSNVGLTYCPYLLVTKSDSTRFKVCVDGNRNEITAFFTDAINMWQNNK